MKIYVVVGDEDCEPSIVCGVYEDPALALAAITACRAQDDANVYFKKLYSTVFQEFSAEDRAAHSGAAFQRWKKRLWCELSVHAFDLNAPIA